MPKIAIAKIWFLKAIWQKIALWPNKAKDRSGITWLSTCRVLRISRDTHVFVAHLTYSTHEFVRKLLNTKSLFCALRTRPVFFTALADVDYEDRPTGVFRSLALRRHTTIIESFQLVWNAVAGTHGVRTYFILYELRGFAQKKGCTKKCVFCMNMTTKTVKPVNFRSFVYYLEI